MKRLLLPLLAAIALPTAVNAELVKIVNDGKNRHVNANELNCEDSKNHSQTELNICSYEKSKATEKLLSNVLDPKTFSEWKTISTKVCSEVWKNYKTGSIYSLQVSQCKTRINNFLYLSNKFGMKGRLSDYEELLK